MSFNSPAWEPRAMKSTVWHPNVFHAPETPRMNPFVQPTWIDDASTPGFDDASTYIPSIPNSIAAVGAQMVTFTPVGQQYPQYYQASPSPAYPQPSLRAPPPRANNPMPQTPVSQGFGTPVPRLVYNSPGMESITPVSVRQELPSPQKPIVSVNLAVKTTTTTPTAAFSPAMMKQNLPGHTFYRDLRKGFLATSNRPAPSDCVVTAEPRKPCVEVLESYNDGSGKVRPFAQKRDRFEKTTLFKTELCMNFQRNKTCTYGNKCHFAHGVDDLQPRLRVENFKTQPCCDPARQGSRLCLYKSRCNYCHPGEAIRRPYPHPYYDRDYYEQLKHDFPTTKFPFGIYV